MTSSTPQTPARLEVTSVLRALADPVRLDLVRQLSQSDTAIACGRFDTSVAKNTLSHHFKILREAGIITTHREGGKSLNVLREDELDAAFPGLLKAVLPETER
ncbi:helix-turn-helix domain-containing protein [Saccharopolyspora sp. K220]|uniref:ArsR/SmtB family transcription factor n=1 Tax=Saccharopolyspora soli TaxID=2926618 RepID=UPI001F5942A0|nr:helix-turn-helix domain-containing protein [Saccharopolyspora soli]MCI2422040.1 helix-turn-helix domain-containing protein [Saccharopolyspora soli]